MGLGFRAHVCVVELLESLVGAILHTSPRVVRKIDLGFLMVMVGNPKTMTEGIHTILKEPWAHDIVYNGLRLGRCVCVCVI